jgi:hypothetical protein
LADSWRVVVRTRGRVERSRFASLEEALEFVSAEGRELQRTTRSRPVDTKVLGRFEPAQQVAARFELSGPGRARAGLDVHGDGSASAFVGRLRRRELAGDSAYEALRGELTTRA